MIFKNYFASKTILLNILPNFAIYSFKYFVLHIMIKSGNGTFLYYSTNQISVAWYEIVFLHQSKSNSK